MVGAHLEGSPSLRPPGPVFLVPQYLESAASCTLPSILAIYGAFIVTALARSKAPGFFLSFLYLLSGMTTARFSNASPPF